MTLVTIKAGPVEMQAEMNNSATARQVLAALPIKARANTWGDEIYFGIPVKMGADNAVAVVELGDIAFWPPGSAFCIFFGPTPASRGDEIRPASPVNVLGKLRGDPTEFRKVRDGEQVVIELAQAAE